SYTLYIKSQYYSKTCCNNLTENGTTYWYSTNDETGGSCCKGDETSTCCTSSNNPSGAGKYCNGQCYHSDNSSVEACRCHKDSNRAFLSGNTGSTCCKGDETSTCCTSSNNPSGAGKYCNGQCYHSDNSSVEACRCHKSNNSAYLSGNTGSKCCNSENDSDTCCTSSNNPNGSGTWSSGSCTHCTSNTQSDACCKALRGSNCSLSGGSCTCPGDCSGKECNGTCYTSKTENDAACKCYEGSGAKLCSETCCTSETASDACCKCFKGSDYSLSGSSCAKPEQSEWSVCYSTLAEFAELLNKECEIDDYWSSFDSLGLGGFGELATETFVLMKKYGSNVDSFPDVSTNVYPLIAKGIHDCLKKAIPSIGGVNDTAQTNTNSTFNHAYSYCSESTMKSDNNKYSDNMSNMMGYMTYDPCYSGAGGACDSCGSGTARPDIAYYINIKKFAQYYFNQLGGQVCKP
ncbi:hypothetical protein IJ818_01815, partial [bacterium]|nr:hypothetical protein [bacterium]